MGERMMIMSKFQSAIVEFAADNPKTNLYVEAVAGSGKTKTIELIQNKIGGRNLYLVFNKRNQVEAQEKLPGVDVRTFNGFGYGLLYALGKGRFDQYKTFKIYDSYGYNKKYKVKIAQLVSLLRNYANLSDTIDEALLDRIMEKHDITLPDEARSILNSVFALCVRETGIRDFDDQLFFPIYKDLIFPCYKNVYVDEAQDLNPIKQRMVLKLASDGARIIIVGDRNQAIYGFAGADVDSIDTLRSLLPGTELPLNVNYRCSKAVIIEAQRLVPHIEYHENAPEGKVEEVDTLVASEGDFVLCRTTAPLVSKCLDYIRRGIKATILGRDIGQGLIDIIKELGNEYAEVSVDKLDDWYNAEYLKLSRVKRDTTTLTDKYDTIKALFEGCATYKQVINTIERIFSDEVTGVVFSTIHKSKGLEANNIHIIRPELLPHPNAKSDWAQRQEKNLEYVAVTRARQNLFKVVGK